MRGAVSPYFVRVSLPGHSPLGSLWYQPYSVPSSSGHVASIQRLPIEESGGSKRIDSGAPSENWSRPALRDGWFQELKT